MIAPTAGQEDGGGVVRSVVFDLGGVLLDWNPQRLFADHYPDPVERAEVREVLFAHGDWAAFDRGDLSEDELIDRAQQRSGRSRDEFALFLAAVRRSLIAKPETVRILRALQSRNVPLYCLSNMPVSVYEHLREAHDFWDAFRGIVISGEVRKVKPEREVYELLLGRYGLAPASTVFIDDHPPNIAGAQALGIDAFRFEDAEQCRRELELRLGYLLW